MSSRPKRCTVSRISFSQSAFLVTSAAMNTVLPPRSFTAFSAFAALRPAITTVAPAPANPRAMPRPMPPLPPVTIATLPVRSNRFIRFAPSRVGASIHRRTHRRNDTRKAAAMKITKIETLRLGEFPNLIWVQVHTDAGITGLGETFYGARAVEQVMHETVAPLMLGQNPLQIEKHSRKLLQN